ncbi:sporozoite-associated mosquito saliva protein 1-like [Onthophagus taurus]|uniref:sporozoite-associated mosquito saliva protein 1-like n=1 Tax=Onthophagus taurus TaxID=166361 RepID=UPI0039BDC561
MSAKHNISLAFFVIACAFIKTALSCGGYSLEVKSIKNCVDNGILRVSNDFTIEFDKKCNVIPKGCYTIAKDFDQFLLKFALDKEPIRNVSGEIDVCKLAEKPSVITGWLGMLGLPNKCPVKASEKCFKGEKKFNVWLLKMFLGLVVGDIKIKVEGEYGNGDVSCIEVEAVFSSKKN